MDESRIKTAFSSFDTNKDDYLGEEFSAALAAIAKASKNKQPRESRMRPKRLNAKSRLQESGQRRSRQ